MSVGAQNVTIYAGGIRHETRLGTVTTDRPLSPSVLEALIREFERQGCHPRDVVSATPVGGESGRFVFERADWVTA